MTKTNEIEVYDKSNISIETGEMQEWDDVIFPNVIRSRLVALIKANLQSTKPKAILDYGCGGGWLSIILSRWGFDVIGIDLNAHLVGIAKLVCAKANFVLCDGEKLPFRDDAFDYVIGISILHHLNLKRSCNEFRKILSNKAHFMFEEPNLLNPFSGIGRKLFPMETHTKSEKPFVPRHLRTALNESGFSCNEVNYLFFIAFPFSRIFKIAEIRPPSLMVKILSSFESMMEKVPGLNQLNSSLVIVGKINK